MHEVSVTLRLWALHSIQLPTLLILLQSPAAPASLQLPRGYVVTLCTPPTRRWVYGRILLPHTNGPFRVPQHLFSVHDHGRQRSDRGPQHLSCPDVGLTVHWAVSVQGGVRPAGDPVDSDPGAVLEDDPHPRSDAGRPLVSPHSGADGLVQGWAAAHFTWILTVFTSFACYPGRTSRIGEDCRYRTTWRPLTSLAMRPSFPTPQGLRSVRHPSKFSPAYRAYPRNNPGKTFFPNWWILDWSFAVIRWYSTNEPNGIIGLLNGCPKRLS